MAIRIPIPGLKKEFPDLDRAMAYDLARAKKCCGKDSTSEITKKYRKLAEERRKASQPKRL